MPERSRGPAVQCIRVSGVSPRESGAPAVRTRASRPPDPGGSGARPTSRGETPGTRRRRLAGRRPAVAALALALLAPAGAHGFPWSTDMYRGQAVQAFELPPRVMPPGTLPVEGAPPPMRREDAARLLRNPLVPTPDHLARGRELFLITCATCHGADGKGDGPTARRTVLPPADLTAGMPAQRTDGYLYATIRDGSVVMPPYGDATSDVERWEIVLFLRALQRQPRTP